MESAEVRIRSAYITLLLIQRVCGPGIMVLFGGYQPVERAIWSLKIAAHREGVKL